MLSCLQIVKRENKKRPEYQPYGLDITLLVDRSGSMMSMGDSVTKGVEEFIQEQKKNKCQENKITIVSFDDTKQVLPGFNNCNIHNCPEINKDDLKPRGMTRLVDTAMEEAINQQKRKDIWYQNLSNEVRLLNPEYKCIFALLTDGQDNQSKKFSSSDMKKYLYRMQKSKNLICYFLGANQDAINTGQNYGFTPDNSLTYSSQPMTALNAMRSLSSGVSRAVSGNCNIGFTKLQRESSCATNTNISNFDSTTNTDYNFPIGTQLNHQLPPPPLLLRRQPKCLNLNKIHTIDKLRRSKRLQDQNIKK